MLILSLDTAIQRCSVAITREGAPLCVRAVNMERGHAEHLAPMVAAAIGEAGVEPLEIDRIGVVAGPGGFTGVRVALSFARAFSLAANAPAVGVSSLAALSAKAMEKSDARAAAAMIDARRGEVYAGLYDRDGVCIATDFVAPPEEAFAQLSRAAAGADVVLTGSGAGLGAAPHGWARIEGEDQIDPVIVAKLAAAADDPTAPPAPIYLRAPDAKPPAVKLGPTPGG
ncbi:MAG: tRNA (adenosine(37)-N6)-threonylcarbamoyltransferase complex dimerization subunit type 1 TsaB [Pseudomonadota bacterium]